MRVLAIDTALNACSVAVSDGDALHMASEPLERGHAERLMTMIGEVLADAGLCFSQLDRIAVTIGPGSFTGVRVGLAAARGLGLVLKKPVVGITTLAALAGGVQDTTNRPLAVAIDARRGEIYGQIFNEGVAASEPVVVGIQDFAAALPRAVALAGSAAEAVAELAREAGRDVTVLNDAGAPDIAVVARMATTMAEPDRAPKPLYLRQPDAKPQDNAAIQRV